MSHNNFGDGTVVQNASSLTSGIVMIIINRKTLQRLQVPDSKAILVTVNTKRVALAPNILAITLLLDGRSPGVQ